MLRDWVWRVRIALSERSPRPRAERPGVAPPSPGDEFLNGEDGEMGTGGLGNSVGPKPSRPPVSPAGGAARAFPVAPTTCVVVIAVLASTELAVRHRPWRGFVLHAWRPAETFRISPNSMSTVKMSCGEWLPLSIVNTSIAHARIPLDALKNIQAVTTAAWKIPVVFMDSDIYDSSTSTELSPDMSDSSQEAGRTALPTYWFQTLPEATPAHPTSQITDAKATTPAPQAWLSVPPATIEYVDEPFGPTVVSLNAWRSNQRRGDTRPSGISGRAQMDDSYGNQKGDDHDASGWAA